jgi:hypothetical protein
LSFVYRERRVGKQNPRTTAQGDIFKIQHGVLWRVSNGLGRFMENIVRYNDVIHIVHTLA